jgi:DNA ligase-1
MLDRLKSFIEASNTSNSNTHKLETLRYYDQDVDVLKALVYTYSPYKQYYVTSANCKKRSDLYGVNHYANLFNLLDDLNDRLITGHAAIKAVNSFVRDNSEFEETIWAVIDRNLKTRSTVAMINKVIPNLIPTFDVALAETYNEKTKDKINLSDGWYVSRKLDGVRCICIVDEEGNVKLYSRNGKEFLTLSKVSDKIKQSGLKNIVIDGEICIVDEEGNEDFQSIMKEIGKKNHTIESPKLIAFDALSHVEFDTGASLRTFSQRYEFLQYVITSHKFDGLIDWTPQTLVTSLEEVEKELVKATKLGWEGLMLRKDTTYKGKRSKDILKMKTFHDEEYKVVDVEHSINRVIVEGREIEEEMLKNVIIEHKGNRVQVGSGFSIDQRRHFYQNPDQIVGKMITVQYFEETKNQNGEYSLRFPVIKTIWDRVREY